MTTEATPGALGSTEGLGHVRVGFIVDGRLHTIRVPDYPTLTSNAMALKQAAGIAADYHFAIVQQGFPDRVLRDTEAVALDRAGTTTFSAWPRAVAGG